MGRANGSEPIAVGEPQAASGGAGGGCTEGEDRRARAEDEVSALRREIAKLRRDLEDARAAQRDQQTFFALVAHQLKGPILPLEVSIHAIRRAIERGKPLPPDTLPRALRQTRRLARIIDALLVDLPGIETGTVRVTPVPFDLREPVRAAVGELRMLNESRELSLREPAEPVRVRCDPERVTQIVTSLLDNALKYSPPGTPIETTVSVENGSAVVTIVDRGIGIPEVEQGQMFTKFFRGSNAPSYLYKGLGVGLYLASRFAELCHGRLEVESAEGKGTTCRLVLPSYGGNG